MNDMEIGQRLRYCRQARGLTQGALGAPVDLTFQQIQKYEKGTNRVSVSMLYRLCRVLGVSITTFLEEKNTESSLLEVPEIVRLYMACSKRKRRILRIIARELAK